MNPNLAEMFLDFTSGAQCKTCNHSYVKHIGGVCADPGCKCPVYIALPFKLAAEQLAVMIEQARLELLRPGIYRHHKGPDYLLLRVGEDSTNGRNQEPVVGYEPLSGDHVGEFRTRRLSEWMERVEWPDGIWRPRFTAVWRLK